MEKDLQVIQVTKEQCLYYYRLMYIFIIMHIHIHSWTKVTHMWMYGGGGGLAAKLCPTLCDPMDCSLPGSSVQGISQARILELPFISPRDPPRPGVESCIAGGFFYWWATREAHVNVYSYAYVCVYLYLYMQRKYLRVHTQNRVYLLEENLGRKGDF